MSKIRHFLRRFNQLLYTYENFHQPFSENIFVFPLKKAIFLVGKESAAC